MYNYIWNSSYNYTQERPKMQENTVQEKNTLIDQAYNNILIMIGDGRLRPSEIISHRSLAETLNISKQPIGIALQKLEADGVVESMPRIGTLVRQVTAEDMWGMLQWRIGLEMRTIALASEYIGNSQLEKLQDMAAELDQNILKSNGSGKELRQQDMEFHLFLADCSECLRLRQELSKLNIYYLKSVLCEAVRVTRSEALSPRSFISHAKLVDAIRNGNSENAAETMRRHIESSSDMRKFTEWYKAQKSKNIESNEK